MWPGPYSLNDIAYVGENAGFRIMLTAIRNAMARIVRTRGQRHGEEGYYCNYYLHIPTG